MLFNNKKKKPVEVDVFSELRETYKKWLNNDRQATQPLQEGTWWTAEPES